MPMDTEQKKVRIDKWLWAARFFKTRSMASQAVSGGKVHCNGQRLKPAKEVNVGDQLRIQRGHYEYIIFVQALNDKRRPAKEAVLLYEETEESILAREKQREERRLFSMASQQFGSIKKPGKRDRRLIRSFTGKE